MHFIEAFYEIKKINPWPYKKYFLKCRSTHGKSHEWRDTYECRSLFAVRRLLGNAITGANRA